MTTDRLGNIYTTGYFGDTCDFDGSPAVQCLISNGGADIYICKTSPSGQYQWAVNFGGQGFDHGASVITDHAGNVYCTGNFYGTADFDPGPGILNKSTNGAADIFIVKLDQYGNLIWAQTFGGAGYDGGSAIAVDSQENVYLTGFYSETCDFDPGPGQYTVSPQGNYDVFTMKFTSNGSFGWCFSVGDYDYDMARAITVDKSDNVYVTGNFKGVSDFDPGPATYTMTTGNAYANTFILKLSPSGSLLFAKQFEGSYENMPTAIIIDKNDDILISGHFRWTTDFDPGPAVNSYTTSSYHTGFICKLNAAGNFVWVKVFSQGSFCFDVTNDAINNYYITGRFSSTVDFDPGPGTFQLSAGNYYNSYLVKLSAAGNFVCGGQIAGINSDSESRSVSYNLGNIVVAGGFGGTHDFDAGQGVFFLSTPGNYTKHSFVGQYDFNVCPVITSNEKNSEGDEHVELFPNPSCGDVNIRHALRERITAITIYDYTGKVVEKKLYNSVENCMIRAFDYSKGIYLAIIECGQRKFSNKLVIE